MDKHTQLEKTTHATHNIGMYYGGSSNTSRRNVVTRIDASGVRVGEETNVGMARYILAGAGVGNISIFYGGYSNNSRRNVVTRIDNNGVMIGNETTVGTIRTHLAGAGI